MPSLVLGGLILLVALLLPWIRRAELSTPAATVAVETRPAGEVEASAVAAEQPSPERDAAAGALDAGERERADARHLVASAAVDQLLHPADGPLRGCTFRLYRWFEERGRLLPVLDPERDPLAADGWAPGQGVSGQAWQRGEYVAVEGAACSDGTYGLTLAQQERYRDVVAVAAAPVFNAAGTVIAVLSASSTDPATGLVTPEGREVHLGLAMAAARILVDLLHWAEDR